MTFEFLTYLKTFKIIFYNTRYDPNTLEQRDT